jgi:integrase
MSLLFNHGRRHDLCDRNPIQWVRQGAKRRRVPDILTRDEVQGLLANLRFRERTPEKRNAQEAVVALLFREKTQET